MLKCLGVLLFSLLSGGAVCAAQNSAQLDACMQNAVAQDQLDHCASDEAARADEELNQTYKNALSKMSGDQNASAKLKAFERAWIAYRDGYMDAMYPAKDKQQSYGSIFPMEADLLRAHLSREQTKAIADIVSEYEGMQ